MCSFFKISDSFAFNSFNFTIFAFSFFHLLLILCYSTFVLFFLLSSRIVADGKFNVKHELSHKFEVCNLKLLKPNKIR